MKQIAENARLAALKHRLLLEQGPVWDVLASVIQRESVDLLVLGTRGRGGLKKARIRVGCGTSTALSSVPGAHNWSRTSHQQAPVPVEFKAILSLLILVRLPVNRFLTRWPSQRTNQAKFVLAHMVPPMPLGDVGPSAYGPSAYAAEEFAKWAADDAGRKVEAS